MKVLEGRDSRYKLLDLITLKEKEFHVSDIKPFVFDATLTAPLDVARRESTEYFINEILQHRGNLKKKTESEFVVSWLGHAQEHNSWEPYKALHDSEQLHTYLTEHKLRYLIPQKLSAQQNQFINILFELIFNFCKRSVFFVKLNLSRLQSLKSATFLLSNVALYHSLCACEYISMP